MTWACVDDEKMNWDDRFSAKNYYQPTFVLQEPCPIRPGSGELAYQGLSLGECQSVSAVVKLVNQNISRIPSSIKIWQQRDDELAKR